MSEKLGIENLKKSFAFLIEGGNTAEKMINETGGAWARMSHLVSMSDELFSLAGTDFKAVGAEIKDLDEAEKAELKNFFKEKFDLQDDILEARIERGAELLEELAHTGEKVFSYIKGFKK